MFIGGGSEHDRLQVGNAYDWYPGAGTVVSWEPTPASAAKALKASASSHIYLAGRPGEQEAALREAGVADFIFAGGDVLPLLQKAYELMERT